MKQVSFLIVFLLVSLVARAQVLTNEDSLNNGLVRNNNKTILSGYGEAAYRNDFLLKQSTINLTRAVFFVGHKFNEKIAFFSEMEVEDAKVEGGSPGGEISMEQCFIKFNINRSNYLVAGLHIPRIGTINENHLPTTYNTVTRPITERIVIPSTWRELGVSLYGTVLLPSLNYTIGVINGLNSADFGGGKGIREGRFEGRDATARNIAVTGSLLYYVKNFRIQTSMYYGGSVGLNPHAADSLSLESGALGTPVILNEFNMQYSAKGFYFKTLGVYAQIPNAFDINRAYANNIASTMYGGYVEAGYNLLQSTKMSEKKLVLFARYENIDLNATVPSNAISDDYLKQYFVFAGLSYKPLTGVIVKIDYELAHHGTPNTSLIISPSPVAPPFVNDKGYLNVGIGYSF